MVRFFKVKTAFTYNIVLIIARKSYKFNVESIKSSGRQAEFFHVAKLWSGFADTA